MKKISRQYKWQLEKEKKGLCVICGEKVVGQKRCEKHMLLQKKYTREAARRFNKIPKSKWKILDSRLNY